MRVAIADANDLDRERLHSLLAAREDIEIVGECSEAAELLSLIGSKDPDVVFLDPQNPKGDESELVRVIKRHYPELLPDGTSRRPAFVVATSCVSYAVKAFEMGALDFILKPVDVAKCERTLLRARHHVRQSLQARLRAFVAEMQTELSRTSRKNRFVVRSRDRILVLQSEEIDWIEADGSHVRVHARGERYPFRTTMKVAEERLDARSFLRIHRSAIVNLDRIASLTPWSHGEYIVTMHDGTRLQVGRMYSSRVQALIEAGGL